MSKLQLPPARIVIAILFVGVGVIVGQIILNLARTALSITDTSVANILAFILILPITYFAYGFYVRKIETRELAELSISTMLQETGIGSILGFGLFGFVIAVLWLTGFYRVTGISFVWLALIGSLAGALVSAFVQELIFRAILFRITEAWLGTSWALVISAFLFGLIHLSSKGATIFSALAIALQAGILLGVAYALTHRLWFALGIHAAWDFANDGIFGVGVAGQSGQVIKGLLQAHLQGPVLITGGTLGVEASLIALVIVLVAAVILFRRSKRQMLIA